MDPIHSLNANMPYNSSQEHFGIEILPSALHHVPYNVVADLFFADHAIDKDIPVNVNLHLSQEHVRIEILASTVHHVLYDVVADLFAEQGREA